VVFLGGRDPDTPPTEEKAIAVPAFKVCALHPRPKLADCRHCAVRSLSIFANLAPPELEAIENLVVPITRPAGQLLFNQGDPIRHVFIVSGGTVKTFKLLPDGRRQITGFLQAPDLLGLSGSTTYGFGAEAVNQVRLCQLSRRDLDDLLQRWPHLGRRLLSLTRDELAAAHEQILLLGRKDARERVASFLVGLGERATRVGTDSTTVALPMTRNDIADYLGLTLETVSRVMSILRRQGLIESASGRNIKLARPEALKVIADGEAG